MHHNKRKCQDLLKTFQGARAAIRYRGTACDDDMKSQQQQQQQQQQLQSAAAVIASPPREASVTSSVWAVFPSTRHPGCSPGLGA